MSKSFVIQQSDITRCPIMSIAPKHYHSDGTCRCRRKRFRVTEEIVYEVMARSADEAVELICDDEDRDKKVVEVKDRYAERAS